MENKKKLKFKYVLSNGLTGGELLFIKMVIKLGIALYIGFVILQFLESVNAQPIVDAYKAIAEQHAIEIRESLRDSNNLQLPPLETLTNILNRAKELSFDEKVSYFIEHKRAILKLMQKDQTLSAADVTNLYEIIKYISNEANKASDLAINEAAQEVIKKINK